MRMRGAPRAPLVAGTLLAGLLPASAVALTVRALEMRVDPSRTDWPSNTTCNPPGRPGGTYYWCSWCRDSGNIIEAYVSFPEAVPISSPTNACTRR